MTEMMKGLALSIRILQSVVGTSGGNPGLATALVTSGPALLSGSAPSQKYHWPDGVTKCSYYWAQDHYLKRNCSAFQEDLNSNRIHMRDDRKVCIRLYTPGARNIFMRKVKPSRDSVADAEKLRYPILPSTEVHTLRIGEMEPNPYSSDNEDKYISFDALLDITIFVTRSSQHKKSNTPTKKLIKRILRKQIQKEDSYAVLKNVRVGE